MEIAASNESLPEDVKKMKAELKKNKKAFKKIEFSNSLDKIYFAVATNFPFVFLKLLVKIKKKVSDR